MNSAIVNSNLRANWLTEFLNLPDSCRKSIAASNEFQNEIATTLLHKLQYVT